MDMEDAKAIKDIKKQSHIPLVADIHFDYRLALACIPVFRGLHHECLEAILRKS